MNIILSFRRISICQFRRVNINNIRANKLLKATLALENNIEFTAYSIKFCELLVEKECMKSIKIAVN